jgi:type II secretory pathway pseudopilin PulG
LGITTKNLGEFFMRTGQQNKRGRGRNNNNNNRKNSNPLSRSYDSTGPDVKVRGTAQHVAEKYMTLARDAQSSGDRVMAENYLQHAEHYNRIIAVGQAQMQERQQRDEAAREQQQQQQQERDAENEANTDAKQAVEAQDATQGDKADGSGDDDRANRKPQPRRRNNSRPRRPRVQEAAPTDATGDVTPTATTSAAPTQAAPATPIPAPEVSTPEAPVSEKSEAPAEAVKPVEETTPAE